LTILDRQRRTCRLSRAGLLSNFIANTARRLLNAADTSPLSLPGSAALALKSPQDLFMAVLSKGRLAKMMLERLLKLSEGAAHFKARAKAMGLDADIFDQKKS